MMRCPENGPIVEIRDVSFVREENTILDNLSWSIIAGEHWILLGANGSGKTSLLKILAGYEWPTTGSVSVLGEVHGRCDMREHRKHIGWVSAALDQRLPGDDCVLDVVLSGLDATLGVYRPFGRDETERANASLATVGLAGFNQRVFRTLSQGERQRVHIARALVSRPALLILDEPCAGLDPAAREHFLDDLDRLAASPDAPTMILVTHHVEEVRPWMSKVHALRGGRTLFQGGIAEVLTSEALGVVFGRKCELAHNSGRYRLTMTE